MALEPEDRTEELIQPSRPEVQSVAKSTKKDRLDGRVVVNFPFRFTPEFLKAKSESHGRPYNDAVDYLRALKEEFEQGDVDLGDLANMVIEHGDGALRLEVSK